MDRNYDYQPLFGETRKKDKVVNAVIATVTAVMVSLTIVTTMVSSVVRYDPKCKIISYDSVQKDKHFCVYWVDILFAVVILLLLVPQVFVAIWYKRGELEPKFRRMIYYNAVVTVLLCLVANFYFFDVNITLHQKGSPNSTLH